MAVTASLNLLGEILLQEANAHVGLIKDTVTGIIGINQCFTHTVAMETSASVLT